MVDLTRQIRGAGDLADIPRIMEFVDSVFVEAGVDPAARFDLQLAIEEACTNVIEHAYAGAGGAYSLEIVACGPDLAITLVDRGRPFNPEEIAAPDLDVPLEERRIGGLGLHLMKQLMDEVYFSFTAQGNVLRMIKYDVVGGSPDA
jgi:anti-sigma regulatory factor (Ser/Thr protein kinase)